MVTGYNVESLFYIMLETLQVIVKTKDSGSKC